MSNRLESLNSKKPSGGNKPSMKFKPKVVARKSKEERAKDAPSQIKLEEQVIKPPRGAQSSRGRGRGGRANYAGTHMVVSGPLAAGSVSIGNNASGSKLGLTQDRTFNSLTPTPEFLKNLKLKEPTTHVKEATPKNESDSEDDATKINMNEEYRFVEEDTVLFPVRPVRQIVAEPESVKESKEASPTEEEPQMTERQISVKSEPIEDKIEQIKNYKHDLETKISQPNDDFDQEESNKLIIDHQQILDVLSEKFELLNTNEQHEDKYVILQLPKLLPKYRAQGTIKNQSREEYEEKVEVKNEPEVEISEQSSMDGSRGQIGFLNIHQSGKITINLGNDNNLNVSQGNSTSFLQEVVVIDYDNVNQQDQEDVEMVNENGLKTKGSIHRLGVADKKIIATPIL